MRAPSRLSTLQLPTLFPTALFVRKRSIVINFEALRCLVFQDHVRLSLQAFSFRGMWWVLFESLTPQAWAMQAFILQVPHAHALSQGAAPEASTPFVKQLSARLRAAALDEDAQSVQSRSRRAVCPCRSPQHRISGCLTPTMMLTRPFKLMMATVQTCAVRAGSEVTWSTPICPSSFAC